VYRLLVRLGVGRHNVWGPVPPPPSFVLQSRSFPTGRRGNHLATYRGISIGKNYMQRIVDAREPQLACAVSDQHNPLALSEQSKRPARIGPFSQSGFVILVAVVAAAWIWHSCTTPPLAIQSGHVVGNWHVSTTSLYPAVSQVYDWRLKLLQDGSFTLFSQKAGVSALSGVSGTFRISSIDGDQFVVLDRTPSAILFGAEFRVIRIDGSLALVGHVFDPDDEIIWRR